MLLMKSRGNGSFWSKFMAVLLRILTPPYLIYAKQTQTPNGCTWTCEIRGNFRKTWFVTMKIKKEKKPHRNHDQVDTDVPHNYQNSERRYIYDPLSQLGEGEPIFLGGRETRGERVTCPTLHVHVNHNINHTTLHTQHIQTHLHWCN